MPVLILLRSRCCVRCDSLRNHQRPLQLNQEWTLKTDCVLTVKPGKRQPCDQQSCEDEDQVGQSPRSGRKPNGRAGSSSRCGSAPSRCFGSAQEVSLATGTSALWGGSVTPEREWTLGLYNAGVGFHEFSEGDASEVQTGISPECQRGDCGDCRGVEFSDEGEPPMFCVHGCHRVDPAELAVAKVDKYALPIVPHELVGGVDCCGCLIVHD